MEIRDGDGDGDMEHYEDGRWGCFMDEISDMAYGPGDGYGTGHWSGLSWRHELP